MNTEQTNKNIFTYKSVLIIEFVINSDYSKSVVTWKCKPKKIPGLVASKMK